MRKQTPKRLHSLKLADAFRGLPPGVTRWILIDAIEKARIPLGLNSDHIWLLRFLVRRTHDDDWTDGREPLVSWSRYEICLETGWSEDKLSKVENLLVDQHLMAFRDAPNCKRVAYRNADGTISPNSTGLTLATAGSRAHEIIAMAHECSAAISASAKVFNEAFSIRSEIASLKDSEDVPAALREAVDEIQQSLPCRKDVRIEPADVKPLLERGRAALKALQTFWGYAPPEQTTSADHDEAPANRPSISSDSAVQPAAPIAAAPRTPNRAPAQRRAGGFFSSANTRSLHRQNAVHKKPEHNLQRRDSDIGEILAASPVEFRSYIELEQSRGGTDWAGMLGRAADRYASDLAVTPSVLGRILRERGLGQALTALFDLGKMAEKGREIRNPAAYLLSIAAKQGYSAPQTVS